jgi:hypothetical protein
LNEGGPYMNCLRLWSNIDKPPGQRSITDVLHKRLTIRTPQALPEFYGEIMGRLEGKIQHAAEPIRSTRQMMASLTQIYCLSTESCSLRKVGMENPIQMGTSLCRVKAYAFLTRTYTMSTMANGSPMEDSNPHVSIEGSIP